MTKALHHGVSAFLVLFFVKKEGRGEKQDDKQSGVTRVSRILFDSERTVSV